MSIYPKMATPRTPKLRARLRDPSEVEQYKMLNAFILDQAYRLKQILEDSWIDVNAPIKIGRHCITLGGLSQ